MTIRHLSYITISHKPILVASDKGQVDRKGPWPSCYLLTYWPADIMTDSLIRLLTERLADWLTLTHSPSQAFSYTDALTRWLTHSSPAVLMANLAKGKL